MQRAIANGIRNCEFCWSHVMPAVQSCSHLCTVPLYYKRIGKHYENNKIKKFFHLKNSCLYGNN